MMTLRSELDSLKRQLEAEVGSGADLLIQSTAVTPESVLQNMAPLLAKERRGGSNVDAMKLRRELDQLRADNMRLRLAGAGELEPDDEQVLLETFVTSLKEILIMRRARRFDADVFERYSTNLASLPDALVAEMYKNFLLIYLEQADRETLQRMTLELDEVRISRTSRVHLAMGADLLTLMASLMAYLIIYAPHQVDENVLGFAEMMTIKLGEMMDQPRHVRTTAELPPSPPQPTPAHPSPHRRKATPTQTTEKARCVDRAVSSAPIRARRSLLMASLSAPSPQVRIASQQNEKKRRIEQQQQHAEGMERERRHYERLAEMKGEIARVHEELMPSLRALAAGDGDLAEQRRLERKGELQLLLKTAPALKQLSPYQWQMMSTSGLRHEEVCCLIHHLSQPNAPSQAQGFLQLLQAKLTQTAAEGSCGSADLCGSGGHGGSMKAPSPKPIPAATLATAHASTPPRKPQRQLTGMDVRASSDASAVVPKFYIPGTASPGKVKGKGLDEHVTTLMTTSPVTPGKVLERPSWAATAEEVLPLRPPPLPPPLHQGGDNAGPVPPDIAPPLPVPLPPPLTGAACARPAPPHFPVSAAAIPPPPPREKGAAGVPPPPRAPPPPHAPPPPPPASVNASAPPPQEQLPLAPPAPSRPPPGPPPPYLVPLLPPPLAPTAAPVPRPPPMARPLGGVKGALGEDAEHKGRGESGGDAGNAMLRQIEAQRKKREARALAIERGEIQVEDPREARERALRVSVRGSGTRCV